MKKNFFTFFKIYLFNWFFILAFFLYNVVDDDTSFKQAFITFFELLFSNISFLIFSHFLFLIFSLVFLIVRYFFRLYKKKGIRPVLKGVLLKIILPFTIIYSSYSFIVYNNTNENFNYTWDTTVENNSGHSLEKYLKDGKHRGMSVFGWRKENKEAIDRLVKNNIEWATVIPFLYQDDDNSNQVRLRSKNGKWSRQDSIFIHAINDLHEKGMYAHLKPHLWLGDGWRSNLKITSKKDWDSWFESYEKEILHYAKMAEETNAELFCIGTELRSSILNNNHDKWISLIKKIRTIYKGKLTYAANWDREFKEVTFWKELDYIGIQAYFPLTKNENPELNEIKAGWERHIEKMEALSHEHDKPILFTEVGYKSEASATIKPWEWDSFFSSLTKKKSDRTQQLAYEAMFEMLWEKDWFSGAYIWDWGTRSKKENAAKSLNFSPQFKPAENTIAKWYGKSITN
ncbi:hypothetical protein GTQ40_17880 [Flavobacteriaceae bacterium R38]|nr:hypothetical protein [Flavobacteriaceae bacterium R38]